MPGCVRHPTVPCNPRSPGALLVYHLDLFLKHLPDNKRRFLPNRHDENPHRLSVRIPSGPDVSAFQTRVASGKSVGMSAYLLISRTAALSATALNASRTSGAADIEKGSEAVRSISDIQKEVKSLGDHGAGCDDSRAAQIGMTSVKSVVSEQPKKPQEKTSQTRKRTL
jgi:hypothetical protein